MPIEYAVVDNFLTVPPSYSARATPKLVLDYDELARQINIHNPTIPEATAKSVLEAFREEVVFQLAEGNSINLSRFVSFVATMPIRLDSVNDPLPSNPLDVKAKPSKPLKDAIRDAASFTRLAYSTKQPNVSGVSDTNSGLSNYVRNGFGFEITGSNIGFDATDTNQGVFLESEAGNSIRQSNISLNDPSKIIITPLLDDAVQPAGANSVEQNLTIVTKYTANGVLRSGTFGRPSRTTNVVEDGAIQVFVSGGAASGPATISSYLGAQVDCRIIAQLKPDNVMTLSAATLTGDPGQALDVTANGAFVLEGLAADVEVTVSDYDTLYASVLAYGRYMVEVCDLSPLTP